MVPERDVKSEPLVALPDADANLTSLGLDAGSDNEIVNCASPSASFTVTSSMLTSGSPLGPPPPDGLPLERTVKAPF